ncbi:response regulator [Spartinivicinus ruber]|uniref:response regulator n=1 Tax=Spartinivicinus ruber TaxID=2683272 RepID=UPI0013D615D6|nr:response regulator [Spartinivicinus ruber]
MQYSFNKVLHVDDQAVIRELVILGFENTDIHVNSVDSATACMEAINSFCPDVVLLDFFLADSDDENLADKIYEYNPNIPIIFLSGRNKNIILSEKKLPNIAGVITKPFVPENIPAQIEELLTSTNQPIQSSSTSSNRLTALTEKYQHYLKHEVKPTIEHYWNAIINQQSLTSNLHELILETHKIVGTAGIYGMQALSSAAADFENLLLAYEQRNPTHAEDLIKDGELLYCQLMYELDKLD